MSLLIHDATIITVDPARRVFEPGAVYIEGSRIADVGPSKDIERRHPSADRVIDGHRKVVIPGFVSTHTHVGYTVFRGRAEDAGLGCVTGQYFPMATVIRREERLAVGALTYAELLRSGVTTVLEMEEDADVYAPFVEQLGIRSAIGIMIHDVEVEGLRRNEYRFSARLHEAQLRQAVEFAKRWHGKAQGRITALMTPNMTIASSPAQLRAVRHAADRLGLRLSTHLGWGPAEAETTMRLYGKRPVPYLVDEGFLAGDVVAAHCYDVEEADVELLARSGASVAHCPLMNAVRGYIGPAEDLLRRGVTVGLGIDNMFADFFEVVRLCVLAARIRARDARTMLSMDAIELATMGGARALGMDKEIGSVEVGKRADLVVVDYRSFGLTPTLDAVQNLVYHAHAGDVEMVLVDGAVVVDGRRVRTVDAAALVDRAQDAAVAAWERFVARYGGYLAA